MWYIENKLYFKSLNKRDILKRFESKWLKKELF
jgi:hypothetical protein